MHRLSTFKRSQIPGKHAVTFDPKNFEAEPPKLGMEQISEVTEWISTKF